MGNYSVVHNLVYHTDPGPGSPGPVGPIPPNPGAGSPPAGSGATGGGGGVPSSNEGSGGKKQGSMGDPGLKKRRGDPANHKQPCDCGHPNCGKNREKQAPTPPGSPPPPSKQGDRPPLVVAAPKTDEKKDDNTPPKVPLNFGSIGTAFAFLLGVLLLIFAGSQKPVTDDQKKSSAKAFDDLGRVYAGKAFDNPYITTVVNFITVHIAIVAEHSGDKIIDWIKRKGTPPSKDGTMRPGERLDGKTTVL